MHNMNMIISESENAYVCRNRKSDVKLCVYSKRDRHSSKNMRKYNEKCAIISLNVLYTGVIL